ncbi:MAG: hypothetical protein D6744_06700 [Planctomycetota bacterium]|nr:MAG: hypothetical protein D6744_06700 [Planctomycetota bacterium]
MVWLGPAILGVILIAFGILILLVPQILVALIASAFIIVGLALIGIAISLSNARQTSVTYRRVERIDPFSDDL